MNNKVSEEILHKIKKQIIFISSIRLHKNKKKNQAENDIYCA